MTSPSEKSPPAPGPEGNAPRQQRESLAAVARWELIGLLAVGIVGGLIILALALLVGRTSAAVQAKREREAGAGAQRATPVVVKVLAPETVIDRIRLPGIIYALTDVEVPAEVAGQVLGGEQAPLADGAAVSRGQTLLAIDPRDYQIALARAEAALVLARETHARTQALARQGVRTPSDLDRDQSVFDQASAQVAAARLALDRCVIRSPLDGIVDDVVPEIGEYLTPGRKVARLLDVSRVKVEVGIPEKDVVAVRRLVEAGERVTFAIDAVRPGHTAEGRCVYLSRAPRPEALIYTLRLELDNPDGLLQPGMFVAANVIKERRPGAIVVPLFAVIARGEEHYAFVVEDAADGQGRVARQRRVELGIFQDRSVEIRSGLALGERLVVVGQRSLSEATAVKVTRTVEDLAELLR